MRKCVYVHVCVCVIVLQEGVAVALEQEIPLIGTPDSFFRKMQQDFFSKRDEIAEVLSAVGFKPIVPESGYFMVADTTPLGMSAHMYSNHGYTCWLRLSVELTKFISLLPSPLLCILEYPDSEAPPIRISHSRLSAMSQLHESVQLRDHEWQAHA